MMRRSVLVFVLFIFAVFTVLVASDVCQDLVFNGGFDRPRYCSYDDTAGQTMISPGSSDTTADVQRCSILQGFTDPSGITFSSFCRVTFCFSLEINIVGGPGTVYGLVYGANTTLVWEAPPPPPNNSSNVGRRRDICLDYQQDATPSTPAITGETFRAVSFQFLANNGVAMNAALDNVRLEVCTTCSPSGVKGDPHFVSWTGKNFNYHGGCDTNLVSDDKWLNGKGLLVQIRTKIRRSWSFITAAAIRIDGDTLEVRGSDEGGQQRYWFNGEYLAAHLTEIGGLEITHRVKGKSQFYVIHIGNGKRIVIKSYREFVRVDFENPTKALYGNTVGILGNFTTGEMLARDGSTVIEDVDEFGRHWQVQPYDPVLFHNVEGPQSSAGQECQLPPTRIETKRMIRRRRLSEETVTKEDAEKACSGSSEKEHCVFDVMATGDLDMAGAY